MNGFEFARNIGSASPDVALVLMIAFEIHKTEFSLLFPSTTTSDLVTKSFTNALLLKIVQKHFGNTEQLSH